MRPTEPSAATTASKSSPLSTMFLLELRVLVKNHLATVVIVVAVVFGCLIRFALPAEIDGTVPEFVTSTSPRFETLVDAAERQEHVNKVGSVDEVKTKVAATDNALGVVFKEVGGRPAATLVHQGNESPRNLRLMALGTQVVLLGQEGRRLSKTHTIQALLLDAKAKVPFNESFLPTMFAIDVMMLGFMFAAVVMLQEKEENLVRLQRTTPVTVPTFVLGKLLAHLVLVGLNLVLVVGIVQPAFLANVQAMLLVVMGAAGMTLLGMGLSVFARNLSGFMYPMIAIGLWGATPMYMAAAPSMSIPLIQLNPSYWVLFGTDALLFAPHDDMGTTSLVVTAAFAALAFVFCVVCVRLRLMPTASSAAKGGR